MTEQQFNALVDLIENAVMTVEQLRGHLSDRPRVESVLARKAEVLEEVKAILVEDWQDLI